MIKLKVLFSFILLCIWGTTSAQSKHFSYEPSHVKPGEAVQITYDPAGTPLAGKANVRAIVYSYDNYNWHVNDLTLHADGSKFKAALTLDKQCGMTAFKFISGDSVDTYKSMGYAIMATDPIRPGVLAAGAYAGWGFLRAQNRGYGIPGYYKDLAISDTAFYYWMNNEIRTHPQEAGEIIAVPFAISIYAYEGTKSVPRIEHAVAYLEKAGGEDNLLRAREIYFQVLNRKNSADSLEKVLLDRYPHGSMARLKAYNAITAERDLDKKQKLTLEFLKNFPLTTNAGFDEQNHISYDNVYQTAIVLGVMKGDYSLVDLYADKLSIAALVTVYYKVIDIPHHRKDLPDEFLLPHARILVNSMERLRNTPSAAYWYLSPIEWHDKYEKMFENSMLPDQINILRTTGNYQQALAYAERAEKFYDYKRAAINDDYAYLLNNTKEYQKLKEVLKRSIYENQSSPQMIEMMKAEYVRQHKNDAGFDAYINTLKNPALAAKTSEDIKAMMRNAEVPNWQMTDLDGNLVKFSDLRGKTIVMDFWATWCVPCKASFPGMKLALERFKNDPDVVFYFVDTEEWNKDFKTQVAAYMKDNNYPFKVLFDNHTPGAKSNDEVFAKICKAYKISGIPMKLIINSKGKLRFLTDGYKGSATALADEIAGMVEIAKKD